jgi:hypothetical protein
LGDEHGQERATHFKELETSLRVAMAIRDDPEAGAKNRIEAVKIIARMLDGLKPEKEDTRVKFQSIGHSRVPLDPDHEARLQKILDKLG